MKCPFLLLLYFVVASGISLGQQKHTTGGIADKLDTYLISANTAFRFNGSVLVAQHGEILLQRLWLE
ncbi:hypothetical protein WBG78_23180 [Chryseolinea sp. T2]|uniref:hypothetical protein n=1 Tax=Chryseolinea sp. T2 TaxID=3129255 RepID=UPI00307721B6